MRMLRLVVGVALVVAACGSNGVASTPSAGAPSPRGHAASACDDAGRMFVWGGGLPWHPDRHQMYADGAVLGPDGWSQVAQSPLSARVRAGAAVVGNLVLVWGGTGRITVDEESRQHGYNNDGALYSLTDDQWIAVPEVGLTERHDPLMVVAGSTVFVHGGVGVRGTEVSLNAAMFDVETRTWTDAKRPPDGSVVASDGTTFFAFDAEGVHSYTAATNEWHQVETSSQPILANPEHAFSSPGAVLVFDSGRMLRFDPIASRLVDIGSAPNLTPTAAALGAESVTVWSESESLIAHRSTEAWEIHDLPPYMTSREGTANCAIEGSVVIWGGIWITKDRFKFASETGARFDFTEP